MLILWIVAIICLFLAVNHFISDLFRYISMKRMAELLKDENARKLLTESKPYLDKYMKLAQEQTDMFTSNSVAYREYLKYLKNK